jgi:uncharacterized protein
MTVKAFLQRHPALTYFTITFLLSWGGILLVIGGPGGIPGTSETTERLLSSAILAMLVGPSVAGILLTGVLYGKAGLREFLSRLFRWRVSVRSYAIAILTIPLVLTVTLFGLALGSPAFLPGILVSDDKGSLLLTGIVIGLAAGIFEELGWTGFAVPVLRQRYGVLATGLIVGFLWGAWHYLVAFWSSGDSTSAFSMALFLPHFVFYVAVLPVYRVLMVWVNDRTQSLLVAMLMHATLTASVLFIFVPPGLAGVPLITWYLTVAAVLWIIVAAVAIANGGYLAQEPFHRELTTAPR